MAGKRAALCGTKGVGTMSRYLNPAIRQLTDQQVKYAPRDVRLQQIDKAEQLLDELDLDRQYHYQDLYQKIITASKPEMYPDLMLSGKEAAHDLRLFVEDLSDSADIPADDQVLTLEEVSKQYNVSTKTVDRWRNRGLVSRKFVFGNRKRVGFLKTSVERYVARHADDIKKSASFSQLTAAEREEIITKARRLARAGGCLAEIGRRLSRRLGRAQETIRYTLKTYDRDHPDLAVFPDSSSPLSENTKDEIYRLHSTENISPEDLAKRFHRTRGRIHRIVTEVRARKLLDQPIEYIFHESFDAPNVSAEILGPAPVVPKDKTSVRPPPGLPPYLADLYEIPLLTREQEGYYFRKMNYLKRRSARLRDQLDVLHVKGTEIKQVETWLKESEEVKNFLIRSNLRLVVSVAKRHMNQTGNFFEMVSDGNISLIRAIEKFDYSRGNKFSTYATWAIMKNFARSIPAEHTYHDRYRTGTDELFMSSPDSRTNQFQQELTHHKQHEALMQILEQLEEREKNIILYRFGLTHQGDEPQTLEQLGARFGVTKERIRQLEARALAKLRKIAVTEKLDIPGI